MDKTVASVELADMLGILEEVEVELDLLGKLAVASWITKEL